MPRTPISRLAHRPVTTDQADFKLAWPRRALLDKITVQLRAVRSEVKIVGTLAVGVGLTSVAGQIGLDQQAAAGFYLGAVALLSGRSLPPGDGVPDFMGELRASASQQKPRPARASHMLRAHSVDRMQAVDRMQDLLVDETGRIIPVVDLPGHLGYPAPDFDLISYAVKHLGMVHVHGNAVVRLNPETATARAIEATGLLLMGRDNPDKITITAFVGGAWQFATHRTASDALDAMMEATQPQALSRFSATADSFDAIDGAMRQAFLAWRDVGGELTGGVIERLRDSGAWDRTVALHPATGKGVGFAFAHIGKGITAFGDAWRHRMIGKVDDGRPDPAYAAEVSRLYRRSLDRDMPTINRVRASLQIERRDPVNLRYRQLLLPWRFGDGTKRRPVLTSITERLPQVGKHAAA